MEELEMLINKYRTNRSYISDAILLLRHSDFYYCFEEDAELLSDLFNCAIAYDDEFDIQCGCFHFLSLSDYLPQLHKTDLVVAFIDLNETTPEDIYGRTIIESRYNDYPPSHTWYYHLNGPIIIPELIKPNEALTFCNFKLPKEIFEIERLRESIQIELDTDVEKYKRCASKFYNSGDLNLCTTLALKHNHISYNKGILMHLDSKCPRQVSLF